MIETITSSYLPYIETVNYIHAWKAIFQKRKKQETLIIEGASINISSEKAKRKKWTRLIISHAGERSPIGLAFLQRIQYVLRNDMQFLKSTLLKIANVMNLLACRLRKAHHHREVARTNNVWKSMACRPWSLTTRKNNVPKIAIFQNLVKPSLKEALITVNV